MGHPVKSHIHTYVPHISAISLRSPPVVHDAPDQAAEDVPDPEELVHRRRVVILLADPVQLQD